jgi:hypothetical protein
MFYTTHLPLFVVFVTIFIFLMLLCCLDEKFMTVEMKG